MTDEFGNWNELARLWHAHAEGVSTLDVERHARLQRRRMLLLAVTEAAGLALSFGAAVWIAMQTTFIALTAITTVFFALSAFLQHRMRREPESTGGHDLLRSLEHSVAREEWNLVQLRIGRAITLVTLFAIGVLAADHLYHYSSTPLPRLWALVSVFSIVLLTLAFNLWMTRQATARKRRVECFAWQMAHGPEFKNRSRK